AVRARREAGGPGALLPVPARGGGRPLPLEDPRRGRGAPRLPAPGAPGGTRPRRVVAGRGGRLRARGGRELARRRRRLRAAPRGARSEEHTSELQSRENLVCR